MSDAHLDEDALISLAASSCPNVRAHPHLDECAACAERLRFYRVLDALLCQDETWRWAEDDPPASSLSRLREALGSPAPELD